MSSDLVPVLNLSCSDSEDSYDCEPCPPPAPVFRQQRRLRRPIRARSSKQKVSALKIDPGRYSNEDDCIPHTELHLVDDEGHQQGSAIKQMEVFQQHFITLQEESIQLLESVFEEIELLKAQRRDLTAALLERDLQISSLSATVESFQHRRSEAINDQSCGLIQFITEPNTQDQGNRTPPEMSKVSIIDLISIHKRHVFLNMVPTMDPKTKCRLMEFIAQKSQSHRKNVNCIRQDPIVSRLSSVGLEALRLPNRPPWRSRNFMYRFPRTPIR